MDEKQELEWREAQKITISGALVAAAKQQLGFLAAVDRRRSLYEGPMLDRAIHRYKTCWLPLLAKHKDSGVLEGNLVVPLDCEWIWHCHRLNPVQYKKDCEEFYGRILDNQNVYSSLQGKSKHQTVELWTKLYPSEPFELDYSSQLSDRNAEMHSGAEKTITYDLVSAVKRQSSFYYQVSRPSMHDNRFLEDAVSRYKGFLHLIKRNQEKSMKRFCVPTYDIDLIWHSHQLQPLFYCKDMLDLLGKVLEHDDTDSDRSKGKKLDSGFSVTTKQWEDTYGLRYWRAGSMYRGSVPSPLMVTPFTSDFFAKDVIVSAKPPVFLQLPQSMVVEVLLEIVGVKDLPASQKGNLFVTCSKNRPDMFFNGSCTLRITSETGEKLAAGFQCEPTGELVMALVSSSSSNTAIPRPWKTIGTATIPLESLVNPDSELSIEKWLELKQVSENVDSMPVCLRVAASFSVFFPAPLLLYMVKAYPISMSTCLFPLHGKFRPIRSWTHFIDDNGHKIISLQMRNLKTSEGRKSFGSNREVVGVTRTSRKPFLLAEFAGNKWWLKDFNFSLNIERENSQDGHIFELVGDRQIKFFHGKKLEFEPKKFDGQTERDSITVVEFSAEHPYGKAVALFDMKSSFVKVSEEWFVLTGIVSAFILSNMLKEQGANFLVPDGEDLKDITGSVVEIKIENSGGKFPSSRASATAAADVEVCDTMETVKINHSGSCGGGCGGGCGVLVKSSGCGAGGCGSGCQDGAAGAKSAKSGGCGGGGCGSGCGDGVAGAKSAGFGGCGGGGCGSGCGDGLVGAKSAKSGGCGGCGSGCGGGCGAQVGANGGVTGVSEEGSPLTLKPNEQIYILVIPMLSICKWGFNNNRGVCGAKNFSCGQTGHLWRPPCAYGNLQ